MNDNDIDIPLSPSNGDHEIPPKRQKLHSTSYSIPNASGNDSVYISESEWRNLTKELAALQTRLLETEAIAAELNRINVKIEESFEEEEKNQERQVQAEKYVRNPLEVSNPQEVYDSLVTPEPDMSQMKCRIREKIMNLLIDNTTPIYSSSDHLPIPQETQGIETAERKIKVESEQMSMEYWVPEEFDIYTTGLEGVGIKIEESNPGTSCWEGKPSLLSRTADANERIEQVVTVLHRKYEELSLRLQEYESRGIGTSSEASNNEMFGCRELESVFEQEKEESKCPTDDLKEQNQGFERHEKIEAEERDGIRKIGVGDYHVRPSSNNFFGINWETHYTRRSRAEYCCGICQRILRTRVKMEDHIWVKHFGGRFECLLCPDSSYSVELRDTVANHLRRKHYNMFPSKS